MDLAWLVVLLDLTCPDFKAHPEKVLDMHHG